MGVSMNSKKGQTEAIGIAVIVILVVIGGLYFMSRGNSDNVSYTKSDPEIASSLLNALMNTKTEKSLTVQQVIQACYDDTNNDLCGTTHDSNCCNYAYAVMKNAMDITLTEWNKEFTLKISQGSDKRIPDIPENFDCFENYQPARYHIPVPPNPTIYVNLTLCK